jgi:hypothetical protein
MEALTSAFQTVVSALTPKGANSKNQVATPEKSTNTDTRTNTNARTKTNTNTNMNNNDKVANVRFEPGGRQNVYSSFQSASAEGGKRRKRRTSRKTHRKSKKHMSYRKRH